MKSLNLFFVLSCLTAPALADGPQLISIHRRVMEPPETATYACVKPPEVL